MNWGMIGAVAGVVSAVIGLLSLLFLVFIEWPRMKNCLGKDINFALPKEERKWYVIASAIPATVTHLT